MPCCFLLAAWQEPTEGGSDREFPRHRRIVLSGHHDRDFVEAYGDSVKRMGQSERFERLSAFVDKYETEVEEHGVDRLRVVDA